MTTKPTTVHTNDEGVALDGYDTVAYFTNGEPTKGSSERAHMWNNATWHFANDRNLELFVADPEHYAPQFGGHCAVAQVMNKQVDGSPHHWKIDDGKLYVNKDALAHAMSSLLARRIRKLAASD